MTKSIDEMLSHEADLLIGSGRPKGGGNNLRRSISLGQALGVAISRADEVREHVQAFVKNSPEVMVKITGNNSDLKGFSTSMDYVARGGRYKRKNEPEVDIENEVGNIFSGKEGRKDLLDEWQYGGHPLTEQSHSDLPTEAKPQREVLKIIYSMPAYVGRDAVIAAARAAVKSAFDGHQWAMAHHRDTENQHSHVMVKMVNSEGRRMNPRKEDLLRWRKIFAKELNARGIEAVATKRKSRLKREKGLSQARREMRDRGVVPKRDLTSKPQAPAMARARLNEELVVGSYSRIAQALSESTPADIALSRQLVARLQESGYTVTLRMGGPKPSV